MMGTYAGSIEVIVPPVDGTNSLLMNRPVGWVHDCPFGATSSTESSEDMVTEKLEDEYKCNLCLKTWY